MRRRLALIAVTVTLLSGCDVDFDDFVAEFGSLSESTDPEVREVARNRDALKDQRDARDEENLFLGTGNLAHLDEAIRLQPNEPKYRAYDLADALVNGSFSEAVDASEELMFHVAERERARSKDKTKEPDPDKVKRLAEEELLWALARMMSGNGGTVAAAANGTEAQRRMHLTYCEGLRSHLATYGNDGFAFWHQDLYQNPACPP